ncbi:MAG TPA: cysteine-rich CWC family protein [Burkholderiaceae bacterium]|nr:cysteine-rich CWC family protein [Burkholderiaceae bacterium]
MASVDVNPAQARCAICGSEFFCGADRGACWCAELPPLSREQRAAGVGCLCPACLAQRLVAPSDADRRQ